MDQREVLAAWETFVERGALSSDLRSSVAASWQRSKNHQVTIDRARAPLVADAELFRHRSKHASLRHAARCALENSKTFLSDANSIMILTDPTGLIIDTQGDDRVIDAGRSIHLEHGGRWSEADIGTNAIGAAIAESKPVQIHGAEHFCSRVQRWTCAAVPVHDPTDGELLGVVDISVADGGTLFLDEIGDMPVALQAVLLRLLDDWTVRPVGGVRAKVDVFLVSATNVSLDKAIAEGRFRSDLLYRLNTLEVTLPRLRDRSDFEAIIHHLLGAIDPNYEITPATIAHLAARTWPGNIRELRNMLARFTLANADGFIDEAGVEAMIDQAPLTTPGSLHDIQRARILVVYAEAAGNISETARRLGVSRNTIYRALGQKTER
jgi:transcriptional regulator of acetoin/glycerol metabolism